VQFRATDNAGNVSTPVTLSPGASVTGVISPAAPNGANGWYTSAPSVTLTSGTLATGEHIQYSFNGTTWSTYSTPVALPTGTDKLQFRTSTSTITAGSVSALVDLANPTVNASFVSRTRTVTVTAADSGSGVASTSYRVAGGAWKAYTGSFVVGAAAETLQFQSTDVSGRVSAVTSLVIPKGAAASSSSVSLSIDPTSVQYLKSGTALVTVVSGGRGAIGSVTVSVDGKAYKTVMLFAGIASVKLSSTLAVGKHVVVASYLGSPTSLAGTSATETLTVGKAKTAVTLSKVVATTLTAHVTGSKAKKAASARVVQVKVHIVGSKKIAKGKIQLMVNGKKVRTVSLSAARSGKITVTLPKFSKKHGKVTVQAKFLGSKSLKSAKSKKMVITLP
jgi:aerobic-type carbon monoxide dehydrogenase small subunit (CoxS/CutS family)